MNEEQYNLEIEAYLTGVPEEYKANVLRHAWEFQYKQMLIEAIDKGVKRADRTGVGSRSLFNKQLKWDLSQGYFPLVTGKRMFEKIFKTEFNWFINGETNIKRFQDANVTIWDAWADENGDLGPVYGQQMRNFNDQSYDQLEDVVDSLNHMRDSRRHIISLWNPAQTSQMALPPCYLYFQFFVDKGEKLNMFVVQRSADLFLGIPYDVALFSMLLLYIAERTRYLPGEINLQMVDAHVYNNHHDAVGEYVRQTINLPPKFTYENRELTITDYKHGPTITAKVAV